jgi:hypothetical protein
MYKQEREFRLRGAGNRVKEGGEMMRFAGIDIGGERHMVAVVDEQGEVLCRSSPFGEDSSGYARLFELLGPSADCLVALEATGHYWRNRPQLLLGKASGAQRVHYCDRIILRDQSHETPSGSRGLSAYVGADGEK